MKVILIISIAFFFNHDLSGQSLADLQNTLSKNKLSLLNDYIVINDSDRLEISRWHVLRELAPGYSEGIAFFEFYVPPSSRDSLGHNYITYRLVILSWKDSVFYYQLEQRTSKIDSIKVKVSYEPITTFENKSSLFDLRLSFYKTYHTILKMNDLFDDNVIYGNYCGMEAMITLERDLVNSCVKQRNSKPLFAWLQSPNSEKQVYAVDGLLQLKNKGYKLDKKTYKLIKYIISKPGTTRTCGGCEENAEKISELFKL